MIALFPTIDKETENVHKQKRANMERIKGRTNKDNPKA